MPIKSSAREVVNRFVILAEAGIHIKGGLFIDIWIPASAGMTSKKD
jgi:hypothetical protein